MQPAPKVGGKLKLAVSSASLVAITAIAITAVGGLRLLPHAISSPQSTAETPSLTTTLPAISWDHAHRKELLALKLQAEQAAIAQDWKTAYNSYSQILELVADHQVTDPLVAELVSAARSNQDLILQVISSKDHAALQTPQNPQTAKSDCVPAIAPEGINAPTDDPPAGMTSVQPAAEASPREQPHTAVTELPLKAEPLPTTRSSNVTWRSILPGKQASAGCVGDGRGVWSTWAVDGSGGFMDLSLLSALNPRSGATSLTDLSTWWHRLTAERPDGHRVP